MSVDQAFRPSFMNNHNNSLRNFEPKNRFLEVETMSQNLHPNNSLQYYNSIMNSTIPNKAEISTKNIKKLSIPKASKSKQSTIRFCSSKKKKQKFGPKKIKVANSSKISSRLVPNKLMHSIDHLPQTSKFINNGYKNDKNLLSDETQILLSKYERDNYGRKTVLSSKEKSILTQKAFSSAVKDSNQCSYYEGAANAYSLSPDSAEISSRVCRPLMPMFRGDGNSTEP